MPRVVRRRRVRGCGVALSASQAGNQGIAPLAGVVLVGMSLMLLTSARAQSVRGAALVTGSAEMNG
jgi:hypothetical protein